MITTRELRIGNQLLYKDEVIIVTMLSPNTVYYGDRKLQSIKAVKPILLTTEWLGKFGFEWHCNIHRWRHNETGYLIVESAKGFDSGFGNGDIKMVSLKYVHQLQNIHFSVTGTELIINTPATL